MGIKSLTLTGIAASLILLANFLWFVDSQHRANWIEVQKAISAGIFCTDKINSVTYCEKITHSKLEVLLSPESQEMPTYARTDRDIYFLAFTEMKSVPVTNHDRFYQIVRVGADAFATDRKHIFFDSEIIDGADLLTFEILKRPNGEITRYSKDGHQIYFKDKVLKNTKPTSFQILPRQSECGEYCGLDAIDLSSGYGFSEGEDYIISI